MASSKTDQQRQPWHDELDAIARALQERSANFLSVQAVPWDHNPREIIELGWSYLDPRRTHAPIQEALITIHRVPQEGLKRRNGMLTKHTRDLFQFARFSRGPPPSHTAPRLADIVKELEDTIKRLRGDGQRTLYIIVHGNRRGLDALGNAGINTATWADTALSSVREGDYIAQGMGADLSEVDAWHQELRQPQHNQSPQPPPPSRAPTTQAPTPAPKLNSRFHSRPGQGQQPPRRPDDYDDDDVCYDEWGVPYSDDEDEYGGAAFAFTNERSDTAGGLSAQDRRMLTSNIKVIDTATMMKGLGHIWYKVDPNPTAKEPEDPTVADLCRTTKLSSSTYGRDCERIITDNAGNDAHYTLLAFAQMCGNWNGADEPPPPPPAGGPSAQATGAQGPRSTPSSTKRAADDKDGSENGKKRKTDDTMGALLAQYDCLRSTWTGTERGERTAAFIALDVETYEHAHHVVLELGWSIIYPPSVFDVDLEGATHGIVASHFILQENRKLRNGHFVKSNADHFLHGSRASDAVSGGQVLSNGSCVADGQRVFNKLRRKVAKIRNEVDAVYLVFHGPAGDLPVLEDWEVLRADEALPFYDFSTGRHREAPPPPQPPHRQGSSASASTSDAQRRKAPIWVIDTQRLGRAFMYAEQPPKLAALCAELVLDPHIFDKRFHNAGNDAFYTLLALKTMAAGPRAPELRAAKRAQKAALPRVLPAAAQQLKRRDPPPSWDAPWVDEADPDAGE